MLFICNAKKTKTMVVTRNEGIYSQNWNTKVNTWIQGCSLGLERLGLETVLRRFFERLGVVSVSASYVSFT